MWMNFTCLIVLCNLSVRFMRLIRKCDYTVEIGRDTSFDVMRVLACFFVIMVHTSGTGLLPGREYALGTYGWYVALLFNSVTSWAVPLFVMMSGALLLSPDKPMSIHSALKHIVRIVIVLLVWSFFYALTIGGDIFPLGGYSHLWYLAMTIGLYLAIPILRQLTTSTLRYFLIVWFAWLVWDFVEHIFSFRMLEVVEHQFFSGYFGYFILGRFLLEIRGNVRVRRALIILGFISLFFIMVGNVLMSIHIGVTTQVLQGYFSPFTCVVSVGLYMACYSVSLAINGCQKLRGG